VKPLLTSIKEKETHQPEKPLVYSTREKEETSEDLEGDKPPSAPDLDLESNWIFQERV